MLKQYYFELIHSLKIILLRNHSIQYGGIGNLSMTQLISQRKIFRYERQSFLGSNNSIVADRL